MEDIIRTGTAATGIMAMQNMLTHTHTHTMRHRIGMEITPSRITMPSTIGIIPGITPRGTIITPTIIMVGAAITLGAIMAGAGVDGIGTAAEWSVRVTSTTVTSPPM